MSDEIITIQNLIYEIRGQKVMLDFDLAKLYHVETKVLNQAVKRNIKRFPSDFMFQLTVDEAKLMRPQFVTTSRRPLSVPPFAFFFRCIIFALRESGAADGGRRPSTDPVTGGPPIYFTETARDS